MAQGGANGGMEIQEQRETFGAFLGATLWTCVLLAQGVALATLAFAMGYGWWSGLLVFVIIGVVAAFLFRMAGAFWAVQIALWVLLAIGGGIVGTVSGMAG